MAKITRLEAGFLTEDVGTEISLTAFDRPVMMVYTGQFDSMDGPVTITEEIIDKLVLNHNSFMAKAKRLVTGEVPMKDCPPLQLDHSSAATHTIGRLVGPLSKGATNVDGKDVTALFGTARFLGAENVEKAKDGRYTHVSIGADLEDGIINELSVTPFPAAPRAALLGRFAKKKVADLSNGMELWVADQPEMQNHGHRRFAYGLKSKGSSHWSDLSGFQYDSESEAVAAGRRASASMKLSEGDSMHEKLKKHLMDKKKMSEEDAEKMSKECLAHYQKKMGMDDEKMGKHLADAKDEDMSKMSDEYDADKKKLAKMEEKDEKDEDEKEKKKKSEMSAVRSDFVKLAVGMRSANVELKSALRKSTISAKLSRLRSEGKITPAEIKKLDLVKMSDLSDDSLAAALSTFDAREPFPLGMVAGTSKAVAIDHITKKYRLAKLEQESRLNMHSKRADALKQLARLAEDEKKEREEAGASSEEAPPSKGMLTKLTYDEMCAMVDNEDKHEELKKHLAHMMDHYGADIPEESDAHMSALAKKQSELQNNLDQLIALASPVLGITSDELK